MSKLAIAFATATAMIAPHWGAKVGLDTTAHAAMIVAQAQQSQSQSPAQSQAQGQQQTRLSQQDQEFARKAAVGNIFEVETARIAVEKSDSEQVQDFARRMIEDHSTAQDQLVTLARQEDFTPPVELDQEHQQKLQKLRNASGEEFNRQYIEGQITAHRQTIDLFNTEVEQGKNPQLQDFARETLPILRTHLDMATSIANDIGIDVAAVQGQQGQGQQGQSGAANAERTQIDVDQAAPEITVRDTAPEIAVQAPEPEVMVQQPQPEVTLQQPAPRVQVQQPAPEVDVSQAQPEIQVQQPPPQVIVRQPEPQVTIKKPEPEVNVTMPEPKVQVEQAPPQIEVDRAEPKVTVRQGEPVVRVEEGEPVVEVEQPEPKVSIDQAKPQVDVTDAQPEVRVDVPKPDVAVRQARPEVQVEQPAPQVEVDQARPDVEVSRAEPQVEVDTAEPQVRVQQDEAAAQNEEGEAAEEEAAAVAAPEDREPAGVGTIPDNPLYLLTADELVGRTVIGATGEEIGDIDDVVLGRDDQSLYAVLEVGGFLGVGARNIAVPFERLVVGSEDSLMLQGMTKEELTSLPPYDRAAYIVVERDVLLRESL